MSGPPEAPQPLPDAALDRVFREARTSNHYRDALFGFEDANRLL